MGNSSDQGFDLQVLLRQGDLDIRGLAAKNPALTIGEYFDSLSRFTNTAVPVLDALARVSSQSSNKADHQLLPGFKLLLEEIGCKKFAVPFNEIAEECAGGNKPYAASCAKQIVSDFGSFLKGVVSARKNPASEGMDRNAALSLKQAIESLDRAAITLKPKVLVVDDAPVIIKTISVILGDEYKVYGMTNPTMLEKFLMQITPELFLLDYKMPERNGFELIPIIRSFGEHKETPIIFLTSTGTMDHVSAAIELGACDFLVKPVQPELIREKVAKHITLKK